MRNQREVETEKWRERWTHTQTQTHTHTHTHTGGANALNASQHKPHVCLDFERRSSKRAATRHKRARRVRVRQARVVARVHVDVAVCWYLEQAICQQQANAANTHTHTHGQERKFAIRRMELRAANTCTCEWS